jgi:hypothetical protein
MDGVERIAARDGRAFGAAYFLSNFGYEVLFFSMTVRVYDISRKAINVGVLAAITLLPKILSPAYGLFVDRAGARRALSAGSVATALLAACLSAVGSLGGLYALWAILSVLFMVSSNARTVLMTRVASGGYLGANAAAFSLMSSARLAAPLLAGLLSRSMGADRIMLLAALVYCLCAASALLVSGARGDRRDLSGAPADGEKARPGRSPGIFAQLAEGFARIRGSSGLKRLIGISMIRNFFVGFAPGLLIVLVSSVPGRTSADYGIAAAASALGALAGSLAGPSLVRLLRPDAVAFAGLGLHFASFVFLGLAPSSPLVLVVAVLAAGSFSLYSAAIVLHSRRDAATELTTRGRVYGANTTIQTLPALLSLIVASSLADRFGVGPVFAAGGLAAIVTLAAVAFAIAGKAGGLSN